jgi:hypothetical protein
MAIKTFTTGEVLTAADTNTFLANSGLVFVKQQTVGGGVTSVSVTDAFSSTYDNYRVIYSGGTAASPASLTFALTGSATGYYSAVIGTAYAGGTNGIAESNSTLMSFAGIGTAQGNSLDLTLYNPFSTFRTGIQFTGRVDMRSNGVAFVGGGYHDVASSFTGFTMTCGAALTGGIIYVYGFRKA